MLTNPIRFAENAAHRRGATSSPRLGTRLVPGLVAACLLAAACGSDDAGGTAAAAGAESGATDADVTLRLGYFPNVTHAPALVGIQNGIFDESLGSTVALDPAPFNAGPEAVEALFAGAIDATFIGPNPAINAYARSGGEAIRIVAGSTSGGAFLVVAPDITSAEELRGKTVASPQLGGTQDVALRTWLREHGLEADAAQGGDVSIAPQSNADTLTAFKAGEIAGAWVPEPWATRLVQEGGGKVLVDEKDLWPDGEYVTTHLIVATEFLEDHPDTVKALIEGLVASIDAIGADPAAARGAANAEIARVTDKPLPDAVISTAWENLDFTVDPIASSLQKSADDAIAVELLEPVDLSGIYDLTLLNGVLTAQGRGEVKGL